MTIPAATRKSGPYTGNGTNKSFPYTFKVLESTDLQVILTVVATGAETTLDASTYTVSGVGSEAGGTVTYPASGDAISATHTITIIGNTQISQLTDIANAGGFYPEIHEEVFDKLTTICQQQQEEIDRCVKLTASSTDDPDTYIATVQGYVASASSYATASAASALEAYGYAEEAKEIVAVGNFPVGTFTGDGSTTSFALLNGAVEVKPGTVGRVMWIEGGVVQSPGIDFTLTEDTNIIVRSTAPALGAAITWVAFGESTEVNVPTDLSVTESKIAAGAVTSSKIGAAAVNDTKLANSGVTAGSYGTAAKIPTITVNAKGQVTAASENTVASSLFVKFASCSTASATAAKAVTIAGYTPAAGDSLFLNFANPNTNDTPNITLNTVAYDIYSEDGAAVSATNPAYFPAGTIEFYYDGTHYVFKKRIVKSYVSGSTSYEIWSTGKKYQRFTLDGTPNDWNTVTFPLEMKDTNYHVSANGYNTSSTAPSDNDTTYRNKTTTTVSIFQDDHILGLDCIVEGY